MSAHAERGDDARTGEWKVLVVDDEPEVHDVTRLALDAFTFENRPLRLLHANSGAAARELLARHPDVALILLDVVMESETAGLDFVEHVRKVVGDKVVRIILRTGQPGRAPEWEIARRYEVSDYRNKTEMTFHGLSAAVHRALTTYRDLRQGEAEQRRLERIIEGLCRRIEEVVRGKLDALPSTASPPSPSPDSSSPPRER